VTEFSAVYYDGRTSARTPVRVRGVDHSLHLVGAELNIAVALADVRVDARVGDTRRILGLPGGAQLHTDDHAALATLFPRANRFEAWVQGLERRWGYAIAALVVIAGATWWSMTFGLPVAAKLVAGFVPGNIESKLGDQTLYALDKSLCTQSALDTDRQQALQKNLGTLTSGLNDGYPYRLEFRACGRIGPNAVALPGGAIVVTDALVKLAQNDQQIAAVLAHEIGHVRHRHSLRLALQGAGAAALIAALAGDAVSITGLAVILPTALLQSGYSRDFENEADTDAFQRLKAIGLSPKYFAEIMMRLEEYHAKTGGDHDDGKRDKAAGGNGALDYLSTHPATAERIARALANQ
jgi:Zn-dependent protease with chaperone function